MISQNPSEKRSKPQKSARTMADLLASYQPKFLARGTQVEGTIIQITGRQVIIDLGAKSEGMVEGREYEAVRNFIKQLSAGQRVVANVVIPETEDGTVLLSLRKTAEEAAWRALKQAKEKREPIQVTGDRQTPVGITVVVWDLSGFIPNSQLSTTAAANPSSLLGKSFLAVVIDLDRDKGRIILSERVSGEEKQVKTSVSASIEEREVFEPELWETIQQRYKPDRKVSAQVIKIAGRTAFVKIDGLERVHAVLPISKLPAGKTLSPGEIIDCFVEFVDSNKQRITLGLLLKEKPIGYK